MTSANGAVVIPALDCHIHRRIRNCYYRQFRRGARAPLLLLHIPLVLPVNLNQFWSLARAHALEPPKHGLNTSFKPDERLRVPLSALSGLMLEEGDALFALPTKPAR
jgi:hypothetical protein